MWDISRIIFLRVCLLQNVKCQNRAENWDTDWLNEDFSMNENTLIIDDSNVVCYNDLLPPVELIAYDGCSGSTHKHGDSCAYTCIASPDDSWPLLSSASDTTVTCNCTNDIGIVDIRSVCRWEFASPPACAQEINLNLETQIQKNEDDFQISLETLTTTLDLAFADQVQTPYDTHRIKVDAMMGELTTWFANEPTERNTADAAIDAKIANWENGLSNNVGFEWAALSTSSITAAQTKHTEVEGIIEALFLAADASITEFTTTSVDAANSGLGDALTTLETELTAIVEIAIADTKTDIATEITTSLDAVSIYQSDQVATFKAAMTDLLTDYQSNLDSSLAFSDSKVTTLTNYVDGKVATLETDIKVNLDAMDATIIGKVDELRDLIVINGNGGLDTTESAQLIDDITLTLDVMVHEVNDKLQTQIDTDFLTTATHTNTLVKEIREEKIEEIEEWQKEIEHENAKETESNIWISAFYAEDSWNSLELEIEEDINDFDTECKAAVLRFETEMLADMAIITANTDETVTTAKTAFSANLLAGETEVKALIDAMVAELEQKILDIETEMIEKLANQTEVITETIEASDLEIQESLAEGLVLLEAEFNNADNLEALAALKALKLGQFAELKGDRKFYKAHHHHKHPEGYIHDPLEHPAHLHEDYHPSLGHHHLHITDEDHHVYDSATGYFGSLDESLGGDADGPYPIWNGTAWTYDHLEQEGLELPHPHDFDHSGHVNHTDPYHPHKHDAGFPDHGPHPLSEYTLPHHHHDHTDDEDVDKYNHQHLPDHQDEPFHVHIEESHFPKSPFGLGHAVHNFHPHAHGELGDHIPDFFAPLAPKGAPGFAGSFATNPFGPLVASEEGGAYEFHEHPSETNKIFIAKISFEVPSLLNFDESVYGEETNLGYKTEAQKYADLFDDHFEQMAEEFRMHYTGLYVKFSSSIEETDDRKRRDVDFAKVLITIYFERVIPSEVRLNKQWYSEWLSKKMGELVFEVVAGDAGHDGRMIPIAAAPTVVVDLWMKYIPTAAPAKHYGHTNGVHQHDDTKDKPYGPLKPYYDNLGDTNPPFRPYQVPFKELPKYENDGVRGPDAMKCRREQEKAKTSQNINAYIPQCNELGGYVPEQCWSASGYCWCVDRFGVRIEGTEKQGWGNCPDHQPLSHADHDPDWEPHAHDGEFGAVGHNHKFDHGEDGETTLNEYWAELMSAKKEYTDLHDGIDSYSNDKNPLKKIVVKAQVNVPLTIDYSLSLQNSESPRYQLYSIRVAKIFGEGFRTIADQLEMSFRNFNVEFSDEAIIDNGDGRKRRSTSAWVIMDVFFEKDLFKEDEAFDVHLYKNWIETMVSVSAHRSIVEEGFSLIATYSAPVVEASAEIKFLVPFDEPIIVITETTTEEPMTEGPPTEAPEIDEMTSSAMPVTTADPDDDDISYVPYHGRGGKQQVNAKAVFTVPTRKIFMMDLMNQSGSRYKRESAKLRKLFTPVFEEVDVGLAFTGLDVKFQSTKSSGRKRRAINYAIAEISVHFTKVLLASEYVDTDLYVEWIEERVTTSARSAIRTDRLYIVNRASFPVVTASVDTELLPFEGRHHDREKPGYENDGYGNDGYENDGYGGKLGYGNDGYGEKPGYGNDGYGEKRGYGNDGYGEKPGPGNDGYGEKPGYGNDGYGEKPGYGNKPDYGNDGYGEKPGYGNKPVFENNGYGDKPGYGAETDYQDKLMQKKPYGEFAKTGQYGNPGYKPDNKGYDYIKPGYGEKTPGRWTEDGKWIDHWEEEANKKPPARKVDPEHGFTDHHGRDNQLMKHHDQMTYKEMQEQKHDKIHHMLPLGVKPVWEPGMAHRPHGPVSDIHDLFGKKKTDPKLVGPYHTDNHDDAHGSHDWKDLAYGVSAHTPHGHDVKDVKGSPFSAAENKHEDHHGAEHRNVHGDDEDSIHHHHKNEVGPATCGVCKVQSDCGAWNKMFMECAEGRCICSTNFADKDGDKTNGCETVVRGSFMKAAECPPVRKSAEASVCAKCAKNDDCGNWGKFYMECTLGFCTCSQNFADVNNDPFDGCEQIRYGSKMSPNECGVPVTPEELAKIEIVETAIDIDVETTIEWNDQLLDKTSGLYGFYSNKLGSDFLNGLDQADEEWDLAHIDVEFWTGEKPDEELHDHDGRKRRQTIDLLLASATIEAKYQKPVDKNNKYFNPDYESEKLARKVKTKAREIIVTNGESSPLIKKEEIYKNLDFPAVGVHAMLVKTKKKVEYEKEITDEVDLKFLPTEAPIKNKIDLASDGKPKQEDGKPEDGELKPEDGKSKPEDGKFKPDDGKPKQEGGKDYADFDDNEGRKDYEDKGYGAGPPKNDHGGDYYSSYNPNRYHSYSGYPQYGNNGQYGNYGGQKPMSSQGPPTIQFGK